MDILEPIWKAAKEAYDAGYQPTAVRCNDITRKRLGLYTNRVIGATGPIYYLNTELGRLILLIDPLMPDNRVIVLVSVQKRLYDGPIEVTVEEQPLAQPA